MENGNQDHYWDNLKSGDKNAFMRLYDTYYQAMYAFGFRMCADKDLVKDTIHDVFCELWDKRGHFPAVENVKAYLITILKRKILKELEKKSVSLTGEHKDSFVFERSYEELLIEHQSDELSKIRLTSSLKNLTPGQLEIIQLKFYEHLSYEQIAQRLNLQPRTIYNKVSDALKVLRKSFQVIISLLFLSF